MPQSTDNTSPQLALRIAYNWGGIHSGERDALSPGITHEVVEENDRLPLFFCIASRFKDPKEGRERTIPVHWHEYMEVIYLLNGHMTAVVDADTYELHTGDLLVINSGDLHMTRLYKEPAP